MDEEESWMGGGGEEGITERRKMESQSRRVGEER
jgi:hypothetical protein